MLLYLNVNAGRLQYFDLVRAAQEQAANFASLWVVTPNDFCRVYCDNQYRNWLRLVHWKSIQG
jgi:hypothetical protein